MKKGPGTFRSGLRVGLVIRLGISRHRAISLNSAAVRNAKDTANTNLDSAGKQKDRQRIREASIAEMLEQWDSSNDDGRGKSFFLARALLG
jgi:hypothetical protein